ncbi:MAG: GGDEF domain-containing protein [Parvibaculaceae bacterium]|nr:GGDEF domain-containing protein [Parvibaculaceae bacterium]
MISIDSSTILATLVCFQLSLGIICYGLSRQASDIQGVKLIAVALLAGSIGLSLIGARQYLSANIWIIAGNGFYLLALYLTWGGIRRLHGRPVLWPLTWLILFAAESALTWLLLAESTLQPRIILMSLAAALGCFLCGLELYRWSKRPLSAMILLTISGFTADFLAQISRTLLAYFHGAQDRTLFEVSPLGAAALIATSVAHLVWNFSLIGLISELSHLTMQELANTDPLTGTANRRHLMDRLNHAFHPLDAKEPFTLLLIDLDHLKQINDEYGHDAGDHILQLVATEISCNLRKDDVLGRLGGDEFCVLLQGRTEDEALIVAERIRQQISASRWQVGDTLISPTVSIGVLPIAPDANMTQVLNEVDARLYTAKQTGRNRVASIPRAGTTGDTPD